MWSQKPGSSRTSSPLLSRVAAPGKNKKIERRGLDETARDGRFGESWGCAPPCRNTTCRTTGPCCSCRAASGTTSSRRSRPCHTRRRTRGRGPPTAECSNCGRPVCSFRSCCRTTDRSGRCRNRRRSRPARCPAKECLSVSSTRTW